MTMTNAEQTKFENSLREVLTDLFGRRLEYEDAQTDKVVNPDGKNTDYFKGKADAYSYAHSKLLGVMRWHGVKL